MGYVQHNLLPGEEVEYQTRLHGIVYLPAALWLLAALVAFFFFWPVGLGCLVISLIGGALAYVRQSSSEFAVTNRRVIVKVGLLGRRTLELLLPQVEAIGVDQGFLGRIFGYGNMQVKGTGGTSENYAGISRPLQFRHEVQRCTTEATLPPPPPTTAFPPPVGPAPLPPPAGAARFCIRCGTQNAAEARFCNKCGAEMPP